MYDALTSVLKDQDFTVVEEFMLPGRDPVFATIPELLAGSKLGTISPTSWEELASFGAINPRLLRASYKAIMWSCQLVRHQARALSSALRPSTVYSRIRRRG